MSRDHHLRLQVKCVKELNLQRVCDLRCLVYVEHISPLLLWLSRDRLGSSCHYWYWERRALLGSVVCLWLCAAPVRRVEILLQEGELILLSCPWCCGCREPPPGRPPTSPCSTSPPRWCYCSCTGRSQSLYLRNDNSVNWELQPFLKWHTLSLRGEERETKARREEENSLSTIVTSLSYNAIGFSINNAYNRTCRQTRIWALVCQQSWDWEACSQSWSRWPSCCSPGWSWRSWCPCLGPPLPQLHSPWLLQ